MARTYKRDSRGRFAGGGGSAGGSGRRSKQTAGKRSVESRLERSRKMRESAVNAPMLAASGMTKRRNTGKRLEQHRRAVSNYMQRQKGASRKRADKAAGWWAGST